MTTAVRVRNLRRSFGDRVVIDQLELDVRPAEIVALVGASGCGKTTLLRILAGQDREAAGEIDVPSGRAVVYQEPRLLPWRKIADNVSIGMPRRAGRTAARATLVEVGLAGRDRAWPNQLSGGEAARVALARALVREPELLLLDEPFAALDALTRLRMHGLLRNLWERHRPAVVMVTHDVDEAVVLADRVVVMADGRIVAELEITEPHPRARGNPALLRSRDRILELLGVNAAV